ncbi:hypothetical protein [Desulfitobacterium metallireducens]|uniref:Uncharacterized protein n=1 Tax=Desulfitobacterium metallireducens DSM 15288 TaxID=871968 RepID=W0ECX4_9FIRM|nr:hypothetical protein [Desulfitobacterium metallireducens]AHF08700.1 hypothetical protein DESME_14995 [Desulfitobacterium metallireducens DSM 15288]
MGFLKGIISFRRLTEIIAAMMILFILAISYQPTRDYLLASQTKAVQSEASSFGQEFVQSLVDNSLTQQEIIDLNKRVSSSSSLDDPAAMYEFLKSKGITQYLGSDLTPGLSQNDTKYVGLRLWQIGLFMAMYNKHEVNDFMLDEVGENVINITLKEDKVQNSLDKMLVNSTFTVAKENGEDKIVNLALFDDKFLKNLRFAP